MTHSIADTVRRSPLISEFQRRVFLALLEVPRGQTITYRDLGLRIGCRSPRAIGQALKHNPFAPDVPCHRVIAADGTIGGFFGQRDGDAIERKRQLLASEGVIIPTKQP